MITQHTIWHHENCISHEQFIAYRKGTLTAEETRVVEEHAIDCPFCSDALDAMLEQSESQFIKELSELQQRNPYLNADKASQTKDPLKVVSGVKKHDSKKANWWWAAAAALFMGLGAYTVYSIVYEEKDSLAKNTEAPLDESKKGTYAETNKETNEELVQINVPFDSTKNLKEDKKENKFQVPETKSTEAVVSKKPEPKSTELPMSDSKVVEVATNAEEVSAPIEESKAPMANKEVIEQNEGTAYQDYSEKVKTESESAVIANKKSSIGLKNDKAKNVNPVVSNQMSYQSNKDNNNDNLTGIEVVNAKKQSARLNDFDEGMKAYNEGDYAKSIAYLEKALQQAKRREYDDVAYHLAEAYMKIGNTQKAEALFQKLASSKKYGAEARKRIPATRK